MTDTRRILALDPANQTGWAYLTADGRRLFGTWGIAKPGDDHPGERLRRLRDGLVEFLEVYPADVIACEDAHFGSRNHETAAMHSELRGIIKLLAAEHGAIYVAYKPATIKKFATGHGHARKPQVMRACKTVLGIEPEDDNVADALFILELARQDRPAASTRPKTRRRREPSPQSTLF